MRRVAEPRNIAIAISRPARAPPYTRNLSAGVGRGRGGGQGRHDDAEEPLFIPGFGHGASQRGRPERGFLGQASSSTVPPFSRSGNPAEGLGSNSRMPETDAFTSSSPLFSNASLGKGSVSRNRDEDKSFDAQPLQRSSLNLGSGGFGRGKPMEKRDELPEGIFSGDHRGIQSSRSKWNQNLGNVETEDAPSPAELRLMQDENSSRALPFPSTSQQQAGQRMESQGRQHMQQANLADQTSSRYSGPSAGWQTPAQQPHYDIRFQRQPSMHTAPSHSGFTQPNQRPSFDASGQPRPSVQPAPPPTGSTQAVQQPSYDASGQSWPSTVPSSTSLDFSWKQPFQHDEGVMPQPSMQYMPPPTGWQPQIVERPHVHHKPPLGAFQPQAIFSSSQAASLQHQPPPRSPGPNLSWKQPGHDLNFQSQPSFQYTPSPTAFQPPSTALPPQATTWQQQRPPGSPGWQQQALRYPDTYIPEPTTALQPPFIPSPPQETTLKEQPPPGSPGRQAFQGLPERSSQPRDGLAMDDRPSYSSVNVMQVDGQIFAPGQTVSEYTQGQYDRREGTEPPSVTQRFLSNVDGNDNKFASKDSNLVCDSEEGQKAPKATHGGKGLDYETKVEELFKQNKLEEIDGVYSQMKASQIHVSAKTYGTILQSYLQLGKMDKVTNIYQEMSGILFAKPKEEAEKAAVISTNGYVESSTVSFGKATSDQVKVTSTMGVVESSTVPMRTPSSSQDAQVKIKTKEDAEHTMSETMHGSPLKSDRESFSLFGHSKPSVGRGIGRGLEEETGPSKPMAGTGRGRGKKVESFFNFDFSGGLPSAVEQGREFAKTNVQLDQKITTEVQDEYSQTFMPVIQPGWYAFAPEGLAVGPGVGRGRPRSPQAGSVGLGSMPTEQSGQRSHMHDQHIPAVPQERPPLYSLDSRSPSVELHYADPEEEEEESSFQSTLSAEEAEAAAEQAMKILTERRISRFKNMFEFDDNVVKRSSLGLARSLGERKQPKKAEEVGKAVRLTKEEEKKKSERLKAIEENEALQDLHHTFDQFMKFYGEMGVEPEHELGDFTNPDIEEKPFIPLEEFLEKAKPNIMKTGLITSEKEWEDMVKDTMRHLPYYEEFVERYGGPGRYTAKQENEDLEEIAATLPSDVGRAAKSFVKRSLTTLKSNPGLNLQQKQWMLASMVDEFSQYIVND